MKIIKLESENVKRVKAVEIKPDGAIVRVTGKNANGKTSVLDSILYALGGEREIPSEPVRKGARKAHIRLDMGDMVVERNITAKGSYLKVSAKGKSVGSPQKMIDSMVGRLSFDPLAFSREAPKKQAEVLRMLAGLDLSEYDAKESAMMEERREATIAGKSLAARLDALDAPPADLPEQPVDVGDIHQAMSEAAAKNSEIEVAERALATIDDDLARTRVQLKSAEETVARLRADVSRYEAEGTEAAKRRAALGDKQDIAGMASQINEAHTINRAIEAAVQYRELAAEVEEAREALRRRNKAIESLREERASAIAAAKYPLDGLGISDEGEVMFNSLPLSQASLAEQLKISTAVAMALNPKLRVLRITDGSLLDSDSMRVIESLAKDNDYQVWIEQVDETGEVGFYIEDGSLVSVNGEAVAHE